MSRRLRYRCLLCAGAVLALGGAILIAVVAQGVWLGDLAPVWALPELATIAAGALLVHLGSRHRARYWRHRSASGFTG